MIHRTSAYIRKQSIVIGLVIAGMAGATGTASAQEDLDDQHRRTLLELLQPFKNGFNKLSDYFAESGTMYTNLDDATVKEWRENVCDQFRSSDSIGSWKRADFNVVSEQITTAMMPPQGSTEESLRNRVRNGGSFTEFLQNENRL